MLVFRNSTNARPKIRKNLETFQQSLEGRTQALAQAEARAKAAAEAELASAPKRRGRPSKAHLQAAEAKIQGAVTSARTAFTSSPKDKGVSGLFASEKSKIVAERTAASAKKAVADLKEQRKVYRKKVIDDFKKKYKTTEELLKALRVAAKELELTGTSKMGAKDLLAAVVAAEVDASYPLPVKPPKNERARVRQEYREELAQMDRKALLAEAKSLKLTGYSQLTTEELRRACERAELKATFPAERKAPSVRASRKGVVPSAATRLKISEKHKAKGGRRAGVGIYRVAVLVNGQFDPSRGADLGPYATARAAAIDAKTLLRTAAKVADHRISQKMALDMIDDGDESLAEFQEAGLGEVVDGFIVDGAVNGRSWEAWVYRVSSRKPATSRALLDNVLPAGERVQSMALRANSRRNSNVSFRTRDGRKISFRARK